MSDKKLITGIVIGVAVTATICYIIYLQNEKNKLLFQNDLLRQRKQDGDPDQKLIGVNAVPRIIRHDFKESIKHLPLEKLKETYKNSLERIKFLKNTIENRDGYKLFYNKHKPITKETDLHILYDLTWYKTELDVNKEVNNGRGPVDFKVSLGLDQTLVEFKLASNTKLKTNLMKQIDIYAKANHHPNKIVCIIFTTERQENKLKNILTELKLENKENIISIDARKDNKPSASVAKEIATKTA
jgi:hypothetical protein